VVLDCRTPLARIRTDRWFRCTCSQRGSSRGLRFVSSFELRELIEGASLDACDRMGGKHLVDLIRGGKAYDDRTLTCRSGTKLVKAMNDRVSHIE